MSVFANTQRLLDERLKLTASSPFISWPNAEFRPGNAAIRQYIRPSLLLGKTDLYTLNDHERIPGIYQVDIYGELNRGVSRVYSLADEIKLQFESERRLQLNNTIVLIQNISMGPALREDNLFRVYVEINFICFNN